MEAMNLLKLVFITLLTLVFLDYNKEASNIILTIDASLEKQKKVLIELIKKKVLIKI